MDKKYSIEKSEAEWKAQLSDEEYRILRKKGTEYPHTGKYNIHAEDGTYHCKACNAKLFESQNKFDSGCGWPSFDQAVEGAIEYIRDHTHGMVRTETVCANCGGHLGHVFNDGPQETTGQRYCINSVSIGFDPKK
ncbi:peptide-methionine (R)-S-oxide reductase MsrB [Sediminicola sp. 1XM1-17]|uniref:peptide-methionine (R)-S-oxide reductase MsrB n=1 Tax=Sediminicola sp. 1XM1-17 TaxID=3127702 RepID=UPI00307724FD